MRLTSNQNFEIEYEIIQGTIAQIRKKISLVKFDCDITIFANQPGIGKTYNAIQHIKKNPSSIFLTSKHALLDEIEKEIPQSSHWYGISNPRSPCTKKTNKDYIKLKELGVQDSIICEYLKCKKCSYRDQFKEDKRVLAPVQYVNSSYLKNDKGEYKYDTFFFDESLLTVEEFTYELKKLLAYVSLLENVKPPYLKNSLSGWLKNKDIDSLKLNKKFIQVKIKECIFYLYEKKLYTPIKHLSKLDIDKIILTLEMQKLYNGKIENWYKPYLYNVFDIAQNKKVVLNHATFNEEFFYDLLSFYEGEIGFQKQITIKIYYSKLENRKTIVYNVNPHSYYPKVSLQNVASIANIHKHLEGIASEIRTDNIGVISFKDKTQINTISKNETFMKTGLDSMHYGGSAGKNTLENKNCLVIAGTYQTGEHAIELYNKFYLDNLKVEDAFKMEIEKTGHPFTYDNVINPKLGLIQHLTEELEMYDAFHRNRGLINDNRIIVAFSYIPNQIRNEFTVRDYERSYDEWSGLGQQLKINNGVNKMLGVRILEEYERGLSNTQIAKKLKIYDSNNNPNAKFVKEFIKMAEKTTI